MNVVEALIDRLAFEPYSMMRAETMGDLRFFGWTPTTEATAAVFDATQRNTVSRGNLKTKRVKKNELYPRPEVHGKHVVELKPKSVKDMTMPAILNGWL